MADTDVTINQNVTPGANVAVYQSSDGFVHQKNVLEWQTGSSDPVKVNLTNPLPVQGGQTDFTTAGTTGLKVSGVYNAAPPAPSSGQALPFQLDAAGNLKINIVAGAAAGGTSSTVGSPAPSIATAVGATDGTNMQLLHVDGSGNLKVNIASGGVPAAVDNAAFTAGSTNGLGAFAVADQTNAVGGVSQGNAGQLKMTLDRKLWTAQGVTTTGGWSPTTVASAATNNATSFKGSAGQVGAVYATNNGAAFAYVKFYDKASVPAPATDTALLKYVIGLPPGGGGQIAIPAGLSFANGIAYAIVGGAANNDNTSVAANQVVLSFGYA